MCFFERKQLRCPVQSFSMKMRTFSLKVPQQICGIQPFNIRCRRRRLDSGNAVKAGVGERIGGDGVAPLFSCFAVLTWLWAAALFSSSFPLPVFYPLKHYNFFSLSFLQACCCPAVFCSFLFLSHFHRVILAELQRSHCGETELSFDKTQIGRHPQWRFCQRLSWSFQLLPTLSLCLKLSHEASVACMHLHALQSDKCLFTLMLNDSAAPYESLFRYTLL